MQQDPVEYKRVVLDTEAVEYWVLCRTRGMQKRFREGRTRDLEPNMLLSVFMTLVMMVLMASDHENDEFDEE